MVFTEFPDLAWLKQQTERNFIDKQGWKGRTLPTQGWPTVILNVESQNIYRDNIRGPLSIFTNLTGESYVEADNRRVKIKEGFFYVTNHDQRYTLGIEAQKAHTFNIHFGEYFCDQVYGALVKNPDQLLEEEFTKPFEKINFHNRLHFKNERFNAIVNAIRTASNEKLLLDEKLFDLMGMLVEDQTTIDKAKTHLPAVKSSTREEIVKRLLLATDYIYSCYDRNLSLQELSAVSCLSQFHFLRLFKLVFKKTPHQFLNDVRTQKAKALLKTSRLEINSIAKSLGFKDASSFSRINGYLPPN
jgi:AraC family transcriptional regulator